MKIKTVNSAMLSAVFSGSAVPGKKMRTDTRGEC